MKVSMSEATARKTLASLLPATDPDLVQLRDRIEKNLQATTAAGYLGPDDLDALIFLVLQELNAPKHTVFGDMSCRPILKTALPKLQALRDRRLTEGGA